jgi:hypothetical protein
LLSPIAVGVAATAYNVVVGSSTSLTANFARSGGNRGPRNTVTTATGPADRGSSRSACRRRPPTLTSITPMEGIQGTTVPVTLTGMNFLVGATMVNAAVSA